ncbi:MAG TPA: 6,7-dimethyl-8-ribityllumazine synthase [Polyangiaceae bacterium]|jgi:6,7-dimethyl-8-ribityllumazine synthase
MPPAENAPETLSGTLVADSGTRFAIVASRFNSFIVEQLLAGALDGLLRHGVPADHIRIVRVPGAWEIPFACARLAKSKKIDAVIALGAVIRGATPHFDQVASEVSRGVGRAGVESGKPVVFGVLTTDTIEQAVERAGTKAGNKGFDAALAAIEMVSLCRALDQAGL